MRSGVLVKEGRRSYIMTNAYCVVLSLAIFLLQFTTQSEGRISKQQMKDFEDIKQFKHIDTELNLPNAKSYGINSPFSLPPFDSLSPTPLPENSPPFCEDPPSAPAPPSTTTVPTPITYSPPSPFVLTPIFPIPPENSPWTPEYPPNPPENPPNPPENSPSTPEYVPSPPENSPSTPEYIPSPSSYTPTPPEYSVPGPPSSSVPSPITYTPGPPESELSPPMYIPSPFGSTPSPPNYVPSPFGNIPSPSGSTPVPSPFGSIPSPSSYTPSPYGFAPGPPVFQPPVVYPPPMVPPTPFKGPQRALWCVAKPSVPDPIIQEAMNYACGSGADCESIQPDGSCYHPETLYAHASFAFNSFWQRTKVAGGTCDFGGTAILVTVDPSFDGCQFIAT